MYMSRSINDMIQTSVMCVEDCVGNSLHEHRLHQEQLTLISYLNISTAFNALGSTARIGSSAHFLLELKSCNLISEIRIFYVQCFGWTSSYSCECKSTIKTVLWCPAIRSKVLWSVHKQFRSTFSIFYPDLYFTLK